MNEIEQERHWRTGCIVSYLGYKNGMDTIEYLINSNNFETEFADLISKFPELRTMYPKKIFSYLMKHDYTTIDRKPNTNKSMNTTQSG